MMIKTTARNFERAIERAAGFRRARGLGRCRFDPINVIVAANVAGIVLATVSLLTQG